MAICGIISECIHYDDDSPNIPVRTWVPGICFAFGKICYTAAELKRAFNTWEAKLIRSGRLPSGKSIRIYRNQIIINPKK